MKRYIPEFLKAHARSFLHSKRAYRSQAGQDQWVIGEVFNEKREGFFLDVGAHDGVEISNTFILEKRFGWKGICIEANPETFIQLQSNRTATCVNCCVDSAAGSVTFVKRGMLGGIVSPTTDNQRAEDAESVTIKTETLSTVLDSLSAPVIIDYLSMDIEGAEEKALTGFSFDKYKFNCITIERPTQFVRQLLTSNGYLLIKEIPGLDCFYVHSKFVDCYGQNLMHFYRKKQLILPMG